jgi:hypothetical protein
MRFVVEWGRRRSGLHPVGCRFRLRKVVPVAVRSCVCAFVFGVLLTLVCGASAQAQSTDRPPLPLHVNTPLGDIPGRTGDGHGAYKNHHYRDLFAEQGHTPAESKAKIEKAFQQLFHGDGQEERLYFETGANANAPWPTLPIGPTTTRVRRA